MGSPGQKPDLITWCPRPESNRYAPITEAADFKSDVSTNFTTRALVPSLLEARPRVELG